MDINNSCSFLGNEMEVICHCLCECFSIFCLYHWDALIISPTYTNTGLILFSFWVQIDSVRFYHMLNTENDLKWGEHFFYFIKTIFCLKECFIRTANIRLVYKRTAETLKLLKNSWQADHTLNTYNMQVLCYFISLALQ